MVAGMACVPASRASCPRRASPPETNSTFLAPTCAGNKVFYAEKLSVEEQRSTGWADIPSLADALHPADPSVTTEGYPAPCRYYLRATKS